MNITIMRGVPGSGKSTYTKGRRKVSADSFFEVDGEYRFDPRLLPHAHGKCLRDFIDLCRNPEGDELVVDNTGTTIAEIAPYAATALAYGHSIKIITLECDPEVAAARNVHGVPRAAVIAMHKRLQEDTAKIPPWWPHEIVKAG